MTKLVREEKKVLVSSSCKQKPEQRKEVQKFVCSLADTLFRFVCLNDDVKQADFFFLFYFPHSILFKGRNLSAPIISVRQ